MPEIKICLCSVVRDEDFPMLIGIHRAGIDVDIRVQLQKGDFQPSAFKQVSDGSRCQPFPER